MIANVCQGRPDLLYYIVACNDDDVVYVDTQIVKVNLPGILNVECRPQHPVLGSGGREVSSHLPRTGKEDVGEETGAEVGAEIAEGVEIIRVVGLLMDIGVGVGAGVIRKTRGFDAVGWIDGPYGTGIEVGQQTSVSASQLKTDAIN